MTIDHRVGVLTRGEQLEVSVGNRVARMLCVQFLFCVACKLTREIRIPAQTVERMAERIRVVNGNQQSVFLLFDQPTRSLACRRHDRLFTGPGLKHDIAKRFMA